MAMRLRVYVLRNVNNLFDTKIWFWRVTFILHWVCELYRWIIIVNIFQCTQMWWLVGVFCLILIFHQQKVAHNDHKCLSFIKNCLSFDVTYLTSGTGRKATIVIYKNFMCRHQMLICHSIFRWDESKQNRKILDSWLAHVCVCLCAYERTLLYCIAHVTKFVWRRWRWQHYHQCQQKHHL